MHVVLNHVHQTPEEDGSPFASPHSRKLFIPPTTRAERGGGGGLIRDETLRRKWITTPMLSPMKKLIDIAPLAIEYTELNQ